MKKHYLILLAALFLPISFVSAHYYAEDSLIEPMCLNMLKTWNDALNERNFDTLAIIYDDVVVYYKSYLTGKQVHESQVQLFNKHPYYHQYYDNVTFCYLTGCQNRVKFDKHVQTVENGPYTTCAAYLDMGFNDDGLFIIGESDNNTDENYEKLDWEWVFVDNASLLDEIFCEENVNKRLRVDYDDLVTVVFNRDDEDDTDEKDEEEGPLASVLIDAYGTWRCGMDGVIKKDFNGEVGTYYCGGFGYYEFFGCGRATIFVYNKMTKKISYGYESY